MTWTLSKREWVVKQRRKRLPKPYLDFPKGHA